MTRPAGVRERKKADRREHILAAAMRLIQNEGLKAATYASIAREAGVSRGTVFNYFPYKEAFLVAHFARELDALDGRLGGTAASSIDGDALGPLLTLFDELGAIAQRHRAWILPLGYELLNPDPERSRTAFLALPLATMLKRALGRARDAGTVRRDVSLDRLARTLANTYFITVLQWAAYRPERSIRDELRVALRIALDGVRARPAPLDGAA
ncbi:MAG: TetR/AcrR family transcriptional regulator [Trueperaceae bacterium]